MYKGFLSAARYDFPIRLAPKRASGLDRFEVFGHLVAELFNPGDYFDSSKPAYFIRWQFDFRFCALAASRGAGESAANDPLTASANSDRGGVGPVELGRVVDVAVGNEIVGGNEFLPIATVDPRKSSCRNANSPRFREMLSPLNCRF